MNTIYTVKHIEKGPTLFVIGRQYCAVTKMDTMFILSILQRVG